MNQLQAILKTLETRPEPKTFRVSSIWVLDKAIVLEAPTVPGIVKEGADLVACIKFHFPDVYAEVMTPDADGTTLVISY